MPLIKNLEFQPVRKPSPHLRLGRLNFITTSAIIGQVKTRLAILDLMPAGFTEEVETVGVELKHRPRERLGFEVVTDCESEVQAAVLTFKVPMQAMINAGVDIDRLVLAEDPSLVSSAGSSTPANSLIHVYEGLHTVAGALTANRQDHHQSGAELISLPTDLAMPGFAKVA